MSPPTIPVRFSPYRLAHRGGGEVELVRLGHRQKMAGFARRRNGRFSPVHRGASQRTFNSRKALPNRWLQKVAADFFDLVLFDEGHNVAESCETLRAKFPSAKIVNFSATPRLGSRSDGLPANERRER
jgi:hypothetical protein